MKLFFYNKSLSINSIFNLFFFDNLYLIDKKSFSFEVNFFILLWRIKDYEESIDECNLYNKIMNLTGEATLSLFPVVLFLSTNHAYMSYYYN